MFEFHGDRKRYFEIQKLNTEKYVIPFIEQRIAIKPGFRVLEIGCGEAGVLLPFLRRGCIAVGVELEVARLDMANEMLRDFVDAGKVKFLGKDIYKVDADRELGGKFGGYFNRGLSVTWQALFYLTIFHKSLVNSALL